MTEKAWPPLGCWLRWDGITALGPQKDSPPPLLWHQVEPPEWPEVLQRGGGLLASVGERTKVQRTAAPFILGEMSPERDAGEGGSVGQRMQNCS